MTTPAGGTAPGPVLDLYAGPGGWDEGMRSLGITDVTGIELDEAAAATAEAAGHRRIVADVASVPIADHSGARGVVASAPCQPWSSAGKRLGEADRDRVHDLVDAYAAGSDDPGTGWADDRSHHAAQPVRWIRELRPDWVCLEQVPGVLGLWRHIGRVLGGWGYSVWCGRLVAADYGVPQTRTRAILIASRVRRVGPPPPTHYDPRRGQTLFGDPWVSMAAALGWGTAARPAPTVTGGGTESGGGVEVFAGAHARAAVLDRRTNSKAPGWRRGAPMQPVALVEVERPAPTVTSQTHGWVLHTDRDQRADGSRQTVDPTERPAPTLTAKTGAQWTVERPATTVQGDPRIAPPGHRDREGGERQFGPETVKVSTAEAAVLQGFRADYPWTGNLTQQYQQIGNAVPPPLAAAVVRAVAL